MFYGGVPENWFLREDVCLVSVNLSSVFPHAEKFKLKILSVMRKRELQFDVSIRGDVLFFSLGEDVFTSGQCFHTQRSSHDHID